MNSRELEIVVESQGDEYLSFRLGDEGYGVDILRVQEIRGWEESTRIPNAPEYVKGVLNLRGSIVPILDLRHRLGMGLNEYSKESVVIVLRSVGSGSDQIMGVIVDEVSDVITVKREQFQGVPKFGNGISTDFISGLIESDNRMTMILDVDKLLCLSGSSTASEQ
ncbi:MAG: chemotaxis protein CheW [Gammaproteobacteria bacterium]|nr:chemotaxis protein CheW [Gammaproteobacteria bacterium]